jgi:SAM-dependent methyltransferase
MNDDKTTRGESSDDIYGERCAEVYDEWFGSCDESAIEALVELARGGRVLELGIGTGLVSIPLARRGVRVRGIDSSRPMVSRMRQKPGGDSIEVTFGNFADVDVDGEFSLIFVLFNTFFGLTTQEEQVRCFKNVAARLNPEGLFALESFAPSTLFGDMQALKVMAVTPDRVNLKVSAHDPANQTLKSQHVVILDGGTRLYPVEIRYAWPSELDLMATLAGLRLVHRWESWDRHPFTARSEKHISIYQKPA